MFVSRNENKTNKHVIVSYVENTLYSTNKYSCVRQVHTLYISYFMEHNGYDEPHERDISLKVFFKWNVTVWIRLIYGMPVQIQASHLPWPLGWK